MTELTLHRETASHSLVKPEPRSPISIRKAVAGPADFRFIDALQKKHSKQVGFLRTGDIEKYIANGGVLIAEENVQTSTSPNVQSDAPNASGPVDVSTFGRLDVSRQPIGYVIFKDKYMHREELGVCFQLNVAPHKQRGLVGAALIQAAFDHCAYGTKLFCCWCAQDIDANHFWESIGFVPLAYRAGSRGKAQGGRRKDQRIHIFWQKRIREGDTETPWWYPSLTRGGALQEDRIALPIEPGTHWSDVKLVVLPGELPGGPQEQQSEAIDQQSAEKKPRAKAKSAPVPQKNAMAEGGGLWFAPPAPPALSPEEIKAAKAAESLTKPKREKQPPRKNDPKLVAAAREFRDRYLEEVNSGRCLLEGAAKYDVSRQLAGSEMVQSIAISHAPQLLEAA